MQLYYFICIEKLNIKLSLFVIQWATHDGWVCGEEQHELWGDGEDEDLRPQTTHHGSADGNLLWRKRWSIQIVYLLSLLSGGIDILMSK